MPSKKQLQTQTIIHASLTTILISYLMVWLPAPIAGLKLTGLEIGEWVKFLPQVQAGQVAASRDLFYVPPISLGLMLVWLTVAWSSGRWQTWAMRGLGIVASLLSFPALEDMVQKPPSEWLLRIILIGIVILLAVGSHWLGRLPAAAWWLVLFVIALLGGALPTWAYLAMRPAIEAVWQAPLGIGPGVWLNLAAHLLVVAVAGWQLHQKTSEVLETSEV